MCASAAEKRSRVSNSHSFCCALSIHDRPCWKEVTRCSM